ncbi:hypothetical protein C2S52_018608 [Perilla frutescens var. hirtella]|nr:hypothetical protein C2S52_018608 [Perilla frutescens var. hirtella]
MVFKVLHDDKDVMQMLSHLSKKCRVLSVYVDDGKKSGETSEILSTNVGGDGAGEISNLTRSIAREKSVGGDGDVNEKPVEVDGEREGDVSEKSIGEDYEDWTSEEDDDYMPSTKDIGDGSEKYDFGDEKTLEKHVGEDYEDWNSEEDDDYMPSIENSEDILSDKELPSDDEIQTWQSVNEKKIESEIGSDGDVNSDYEDSDGEVNSDSTGDEADPKQKKEKMITYDPRCDHKSLKLCVGMRFEDGMQYIEALRNISIENGYPIHFRRGLLNAVKELAPFAEHRNCARHIYCNWKKQHKGSTLKNMFWRICQSTYVEVYRAALEDLKAENQQAYEDFLEREPQRFCKAFISTSSKCDSINNNTSETFNHCIVNARSKHVIDILQDIRCALMKRHFKMFRAVASVNDTLCPKIRTKIENVKYDSREGITHPSVGDKFKVKLNENHYVRCLQPGHNIRSCQNEAVEKPDAVKGKRGRPRKQASASAQTSISGRASTSRQASKGTVIGKEIALANKGVGVLVCEGTGNIYCRMPTKKRAHSVNPPRLSSRQAGTRKGANSGSSSIAVQMPT